MASHFLGDVFEYWVETRHGEIVCGATGLADGKGVYLFSARKAVMRYFDGSGEVFSASLSTKIESLGGVFDEKYRAKELELALLNYFGEKQLSDLLKPCLITAYDIGNRRAHFFTSVDAGTSRDNDYFLRDVGRATSSAPTYFEPVSVKPMNGNPKAFIDGGVFANNPAMCAYAEERNIAFSTTIKVSRLYAPVPAAVAPAPEMEFLIAYSSS